MKADVGLEKYLRVLRPNLQAVGRETSGPGLAGKLESPPPVTYLLILFLSNSVIGWQPSIQTHEPMGAFSFNPHSPGAVSELLNNLTTVCLCIES